MDTNKLYKVIYRVDWHSFPTCFDQTGSQVLPKFVKLTVKGSLSTILNNIHDIEKKMIRIQCVRRDVRLNLYPVVEPIPEDDVKEYAEGGVTLCVHSSECIINEYGIEIIGSMCYFEFTEKTMKWAKAIKTYVDGGEN